MIRMIVWLLLIFMQSTPQPYQTVVEETTIMTTEIKNSPPPVIQVEILTLEEPECLYSQEDIDLVALIMLAEAEGECEKGKRLVVDTILNRVDSEHFPNTISDVIFQENQFSSMKDGRSERVSVTDEARELVRDEMIKHSNNDVIFFTCGEYSQYGKPLYCVGNHYFSTYE